LRRKILQVKSERAKFQLPLMRDFLVEFSADAWGLRFMGALQKAMGEQG
jgi:hypothetical protein